MPESLYLPCSYEVHVMYRNVPVRWSQHESPDDARETARARAAAGEEAHVVELTRAVVATVPAAKGRSVVGGPAIGKAVA